VRVLGCHGRDGDVAIEADADHDAGAAGGEVVGHRELLGRGAGDAQLRLGARRLHGGLGLGDRGRPGRCVHHDDDLPLRRRRSGLEPTEDDERQQPGDE